MPRRRTLSPEFFSDEDLATLPFETRLLYAGLWCYADKEGRLEDRPKYLKAMLFPYDRLDVEKLLNQLATPQNSDRPGKVFIRRYQVEDRQLIDIPEFSKHQSPHHTEHNSRLPEFNGALSVNGTLEVSKVQDAHYPISDPISDPKPEPPTKPEKSHKEKKHSIPADFSISDSVRTWAAKHKYTRLEERLEDFMDSARAKGYQYVDWDAAFQGAIRKDWAKLGGPASDEPGEFDHLPKIRNEDYWICGCPKASSSACRSAVHGMTLDESYTYRNRVHA
jgi:hypothetical protein